MVSLGRWYYVYRMHVRDYIIYITSHETNTGSTDTGNEPVFETIFGMFVELDT